MKLDFRQRLLATTLLVGASMVASPAFAQDATQPVPPTCPPGSAPGAPDCTAPATPTVSPPDNSATPSAPDTTTSAAGQTTVPSTNATGETVRSPEDIVITGSRIPQPNLTSASPVTVLSSQEVKLQGTTRTEDLINSLPQSFAAQGSNVSNGATGTATVNLRGLGSVRTLVLINGRRLQGGDPRSPVADINFIPDQLIKRVDVLTGGASSVYGADAVAGVVNFVMDTNFRGFRIDGQASTFMHDNNAADKIINANVARGFRPPHGNSVNGGAQDIAVSFGAGFDDNRGSVVAYATYRKQAAVTQASRDYSFCSLAARTVLQGGRNSGTPPRDFNCGGSATSANGTFLTNVGTFQVQGNQFVPGSTPFNFGPFNFYQRPDERYTLGAFAEYEISPGAKPYLEAMFMDDRSVAQIAPSGDFFNTNTINCDNPLLSAQQSGLICNPANGGLVGQAPIKDADGNIIGFTPPTVFTDANGNQFTRAVAYIGRRNVEGGARQDDVQHTDYRIVAGVRGDLLRGLSYDAYYQYGRVNLSETFFNDISIRRLNQALDVVTDPTTGQPVCRGTLTGQADVGCVPFNIFQTGGVTQAALNFLQVPGFTRGNTQETVANVNMTLTGADYGLQTPWSDRGIGVNVGAEYRKEALTVNFDNEFTSGDLAGQGAAPQSTSGSFTVRDLFTEVQLPLVSHSFIDEFTLTGGYRYSDYKVAGGHFHTNTYKLEGRLAPIPDVLVRAGYNRAVRAPNVVELFTPQSVALAGTSDPCAGPLDPNGITVKGNTAAQCANTGVSAAQFGNIFDNPASQFNGFVGGNPNLKPEKADTYTAGIVLRPRFVPGLALTADYFNIKIKNLIGTLGFATVINGCLTTGNPQLCSLINRAPGTGSLFLSPNGFITLTNLNVGGESTRGIDLNGSYARRLGGLGTLNVSYVATVLDKLAFDTGVDLGTGGRDGKGDCNGFYGVTCGTPTPKYRHKLRLGFSLPNGIGISGQWRYFSSVRNDVLSNDCDVSGQPDETQCSQLPTNPNFRPANARINAQSFFDLALTARLADKYNFRFGANNILDKQPPIVGGEVSGAPFGNGNTFPQVYDALGRYIFAGVTIDF